MTHDREIIISTAGSRQATTWLPQPTSWAGFVQRISQPIRGQESFGEYMALTKAQQDGRKDVLAQRLPSPSWVASSPFVMKPFSISRCSGLPASPPNASCSMAVSTLLTKSGHTPHPPSRPKLLGVNISSMRQSIILHRCFLFYLYFNEFTAISPLFTPTRNSKNEAYLSILFCSFHSCALTIGWQMTAIAS